MFWSSLMQARAGMPCPFEVQYALHLEGRRVIPDFAWPEVKTLVEVDGRENHIAFKPFTRDRQKDRLYRRAGWAYIRFAASEVLGAGGADMCAVELFETVGWPYPEVLEPAPDADLTKPLAAPRAARVRLAIVDKTLGSTVNLRKRIWQS